MRLSKKQQKTLDIARYFAIPLEPTPNNLSYYDARSVVENPQGIEPERAFLARTERGERQMRVNGVGEYLSLLVGHNRAAMQVKAWSEGFREGTLFLSDFDEEPEYIDDLVKRAYEGGKSNRYNDVNKLGFTEYTLQLIKVKLDKEETE